MAKSVRTQAQQDYLNQLLTRLKALIDAEKLDPENFWIKNDKSYILDELSKIPV